MKLAMLQRVAVALACVGFLAPQIQAAAPQTSQVAAPAVIDVALQNGGVLQGTVVNAQGVAQPGIEGADPALLVTREHHGTLSTKVLHAGFFRSEEYRQLMTIGAELKDLLRLGAYVERGKERRDVTAFAEAIDWLMAQAKQGNRFNATRASAR